jgi:hypothetical protein
MAIHEKFSAIGITTEKPNLKRLLGDALSAYLRLREAGCDKNLDRLLVLLSCRSVQVPARWNNHHALELFRADSHKLMLGGLSLKQARARVDKARGALKAIEAALAPLLDPPPENVPLRWRTAQYRTSWRQERTGMTALLDELSRALDGIGPKAHPVVSRKIEQIIRLVHKQTGRHHDADVAEVLCAAIGEPVPPGYPKFGDALSLTAWRRRNKVMGDSKIPKS